MTAERTPQTPDALECPDGLECPDSLEWVSRRGMGALAEKMGMEFVEFSIERAVATMPVAGNTQPFGHLHGGASCVLVETLGSLAAMSEVGPGGQVFGVDINVTHHRSATAGWVTGEASALYLGGRTATYEVAITDDAGERLGAGRITCALRRPKPS